MFIDDPSHWVNVGQVATLLLHSSKGDEDASLCRAWQCQRLLPNVKTCGYRSPRVFTVLRADTSPVSACPPHALPRSSGDGQSVGFILAEFLYHDSQSGFQFKEGFCLFA